MSTPDPASEQADLEERISEGLRQACDGDLRKMARLLASRPHKQLLGQTEFEVRDLVHDLGARALQTALDERKKAAEETYKGLPGVEPELPGLRRRCPLRRLPPRGHRQPAGAIRPGRAYYHGKTCHRGHCPSDPELGLSPGDLTPGATQAVCIAGVVGSFAVAAEEVLPRLAGLRLSESTVQRATEAVGRRVEGLVAAGRTFGADRP